MAVMLSLVAVALLAVCQEDELRLEVSDAGKLGEWHLPLACALPPGSGLAVGDHFTLSGGGRSFTAQVLAGGRALVPIGGLGSKEVLLVGGARAEVTPAKGWALRDGGDGLLWMRYRGRPLLAYVFGPQLPAGVPPDRRRAGYFYPAFDPAGTNLLDDFPRDHYHHRGIFWTWPVLRAGGQEYNPWHLKGVQQRFERWLGRSAGAVCAEVGMQSGWYAGEHKLLAETVWVRAFAVRQISAAGRELSAGTMLDFTITLRACDQPVEIRGTPEGGKGYGGFSVRLAPHEDVLIATSEGGVSADDLHHRHSWADFSARFRGARQRSGAAILVHPDNAGFPNEWLLRFYGYIGECWPARRGFTFEPGAPQRLRYRVYMHMGDSQQARVADLYRLWIGPPKLHFLASR